MDTERLLLPAARRNGPRRGWSASRWLGPWGGSGTTWWLAAWLACLFAALGSLFGTKAPAVRAEPSSVLPEMVKIDVPVVVLEGAAVRARFERAPEPRGGQRLRGETTFRWSPETSTLVTEETHLDRAGRLVRAEIQVRTTGGALARLPLEHISLDANRGMVVLVTRGGRTESHRVTNDLPWVYVPVDAPGGGGASTPTAAIVADYAAGQGEAVRMIGARGEDFALMSDQLLVSNGSEEGAHHGTSHAANEWVVLGDDVATFGTSRTGETELLRLRVAALGVEMVAQRTDRAAP